MPDKNSGGQEQNQNNAKFYISEDGVLKGVITDLQAVHVPEGVTAISQKAFCGVCAQKIYLPDTVERVESGAFKESGIAYIRLSANMSAIPDEAFAGCANLKKIDNADNICKIGKGAFRDCVQFEWAENQDFIKSIGPEAFSGCESIKILKAKALSYLGEHAFENSGLERIDLTGVCLTEVGKGCFQDCKKLAFARLPDSVAIIHHKAFYQCENLCAVYFPQMLKIIESYAFYGCSNELTDLFFGDEILEIHQKAFGECSALRDVFLREYVHLEEGVFFKTQGEKVRLIAAPWGSVKAYAETNKDEVIFVDLMQENILTDNER